MTTATVLTVVGFLAFLPVLRAQFDNGILGDPYVNCGGNNIEVRFDTRNPFRGIVFVEDHLEDPECRSTPIEDGARGFRNASIRLNFKNCGLEKRRSVNPRGLFITASLIVAFHPEVLTKFDRVYIVQCYYMEMEKVLERELMVKMPAPPLQTQQVPMPVCRYEVLSGGPEGPPVFFAKVGEQVYHKWTCDSTTEGQFCMTVHSCTVDDGHGDRVQLLDEKGCAKDKFLLSNLDYVTDLTAGKEAHVYKYADRQSMFFDCQITLTIKEPGQQFCDIPSCPDPPGFGSGAGLPRSRRSEKAADIQIRAGSDEKPVAEKSFIIPSTEVRKPSWVQQNFELSEEDICMSFEGVGAVAAMNLVMLASSGLLFYNALQKAWSK